MIEKQCQALFVMTWEAAKGGKRAEKVPLYEVAKVQSDQGPIRGFN